MNCQIRFSAENYMHIVIQQDRCFAFLKFWPLNTGFFISNHSSGKNNNENKNQIGLEILFLCLCAEPTRASSWKIWPQNTLDLLSKTITVKKYCSTRRKKDYSWTELKTYIQFLNRTMLYTFNMKGLKQIVIFYWFSAHNALYLPKNFCRVS